MLTLFHAPYSRSSGVVALIDEMNIADRVRVQTTDIRRQDGTGAADPANPHPEHKTPALLHDGTLVTERSAVMLYLTELFPDSGIAPKAGDPKRGAFLSWMVWYGSVMEPVLILEAAGISHPYLTAGLRGHAEVAARLHNALAQGPWLLGSQFSAADLLCHSPYAWFKDATPDDPLIRDWVARCQSRPSIARTKAADALRMASLQAVAA